MVLVPSALIDTEACLPVVGQFVGTDCNVCWQFHTTNHHSVHHHGSNAHLINCPRSGKHIFSVLTDKLMDSDLQLCCSDWQGPAEWRKTCSLAANNTIICEGGL